MSDTDAGEEATLFPKTAGERLREAREAQGLSLAEIAARTRIPVRQLEAIETSTFSALPSITYSVGFAKAYARAVGADEVAIAREVRAQNSVGVRHTEYESFEVTDSSRVPTRGIAYAGLGIAILLMIAVGLWYGTTFFRSDDTTAPAPAETVAPQPTPAAAAPTPVAGGQVTLIATDDVWMRIYDATGKTLYENTLKPGDRYDVPADANGPMINIGRPDKLQVMLNGALVAQLGDGKHAIKDVPISGTALAARTSGVPQPAASATSTPIAPASTPTPSPGHSQTVQKPAPKPRATPSPTVAPVIAPPANSASAPSAPVTP